VLNSCLPPPPTGILTGCRVCARAHLYAHAQHVVVDPSGAERSQADPAVASERDYAAACIRTSDNTPSTHSGE
jgi:hypothetical protein